MEFLRKILLTEGILRVTPRMNLESIVWSEVSQKEKNKYCILMHIYIYMKCRKMILMKLFAGQQGFPGSSAGKESACNAGDPGFDSWVRKIRWRRDRLPTPVFLGFPGSSAGKEPACNVGDLGSIPGLGRSPGEGNGYLLQYFGLENSMNCIFHGVAKSRR